MMRFDVDDMMTTINDDDDDDVNDDDKNISDKYFVHVIMMNNLSFSSNHEQNPFAMAELAVQAPPPPPPPPPSQPPQPPPSTGGKRVSATMIQNKLVRCFLFLFLLLLFFFFFLNFSRIYSGKRLSVCPSIFLEMVGPTLMKLCEWVHLGLMQCHFMFVRGPKVKHPRVKGQVTFQLAVIVSKLCEQKPGHGGSMKQTLRMRLVKVIQGQIPSCSYWAQTW